MHPPNLGFLRLDTSLFFLFRNEGNGMLKVLFGQMMTKTRTKTQSSSNSLENGVEKRVVGYVFIFANSEQGYLERKRP